MARNKRKPCRNPRSNPDCAGSHEKSRSGLCRSCYILEQRNADPSLHRGHLKVADLAGHVETVARAEHVAKDWTAGVSDIEGDAIVVSDVHIPEHDPVFLRRVAQVAVVEGVSTLIVNGDLWTLDELGSYPQNKPRGFHPKESIQRGVRVLGALLRVFDRIVVTGGNHDVGRLTKLMDAAVAGRNKAAWILADLDPDEADCLDYDQRYTSMLERWAAELGADAARIKWHSQTHSYLTSGGERWLITHQKVSSRRQPYEALNIWQREQCHVVTGHTHLQGCVRAPNGRHWLINPGCVTRREHHRYAVKNDTGWPEWTLGALLIKGGRPTLLADGLTDWADVERRYAEACRSTQAG